MTNESAREGSFIQIKKRRVHLLQQLVLILTIVSAFTHKIIIYPLSRERQLQQIDSYRNKARLRINPQTIGT